MDINSISNNMSLKSLLASSILNGGSDVSADDLTSLPDTGDTADISSQGQLLSELGSMLPSDMQDKVRLLQSDLESVDPANLSDDDLKNFISQLQSDLGTLPGALSGLDPGNLTADDLDFARSALSDMKGVVTSLGQTGSSQMSYADTQATQEANLQEMMQALGGAGSSSGSGTLGLLTSFDPLGDGSSSASSGLYGLLTSYNKASLLGTTNLLGTLAAKEEAEQSGSASAGTGLDSADLNRLLSSYLSGTSGLSNLMGSYAASTGAEEPQSTVDKTV